ncbi:MAG TPA: hydrogenase maturation protease [Terriglobia bacterium]|nr:hydrogenase maturation protease [Terriglobia bacterium]
MTSPHALRLLVMGIGNPYRSDDAAGVIAARRLKEAGLDPAIVMEHSGEGASLMETWKGADAVILIDAVSSGSPPGSIHRLEPITTPLPTHMFQSSSHAFSLPQAVEMARALHELPMRLLIFGIEGSNFQAGTELTPAVSKALPDLVKSVLEEVKRLQAACTKGE